jgi:catechol 2,3-dioxygenase-like lactoylglutathione lyase family enzyme
MSKPPKLTLHHVNLVSDDVGRADAFYRDVMGLVPPISGLPRLDKTQGYGGDVVFLSDGRIQHHLAQKDVVAGFRAGHTVNPVSHGHIAYRTDDIDGVSGPSRQLGHSLFRLGRPGGAWLAAGVLLRSRRQRDRGAPGRPGAET